MLKLQMCMDQCLDQRIDGMGWGSFLIPMIMTARRITHTFMQFTIMELCHITITCKYALVDNRSVYNFSIVRTEKQ